MKIKFLEDLGIEIETINKIMDENDKDMSKVSAERDNYKNQFEKAQNTLKDSAVGSMLMNYIVN